MKFFTTLIFSLIFIPFCWGKELWNKELSYEQLVIKAKEGSPYHMGLLGIYLRAGEAGCSVEFRCRPTMV